MVVGVVGVVGVVDELLNSVEDATVSDAMLVEGLGSGAEDGDDMVAELDFSPQRDLEW